MTQKLTSSSAAHILKKQRTYFESGRTRDYHFRIQQLEKLRLAILKYEDELNQALYKDLGKGLCESYSSEIGFILSSISHAVRHLKKWMKPQKKRTPVTLFRSRSKIIREPYGSVYIIGPFNYPFQLMMEPFIGALCAGNCAVLSPSELTPDVSAVIKKIIEETFPPDYAVCIDGGIENNTVLLNAGFDYIFFTGSPSVGKIVMEAAAGNLTPVTLELGGKSPVLIDKSASLPAACERILWGKLINAGQTCVAPDYVFVPREILQDFLKELTVTLTRFYGTDPQKSADYGRIVNDRHMERLCRILQKDRDFLVYGGRYDRKQRYIEPAVLCMEEPDTACMQEEIFGPLLPVLPYDDLNEALSYIRSRPKPLALYIFSQDKTVIDCILKNTSSGGVSVNDTISHIINPYLPFGGVGPSGMGSYHGEYSFHTFSHAKSVLIRSTKIRMSLTYPPFTQKKLSLIKRFFK